METESKNQHLILNQDSQKEGRKMKVETDKMAEIFVEMGQHVNLDELRKFIYKVDKHSTGLLDRDQYDRVCREFVKDKTILGRLGENEFFEQLATPENFPSP